MSEHGHLSNRQYVSFTAHMDGVRVVAENSGNKVEVSELELIALCTIAQIGLTSMFAKLDGQLGEDAKSHLAYHLAGVRERFSKPGKADGMDRLQELCAAMLVGERLGKYIVPDGTPDGTEAAP